MFRHEQLIGRAVSALALSMLLMLPVAAAADFKEGDALPDLGSFELEGKLPESLKGQVILLDFWASWCGPCKSSFPAMETLAKDYSGQGLTIIAVSVDEKRENMQAFLKTAKVSFTVVGDARHKLVAAADIRTLPTSFLIDRAGKIRFVHAGFDAERTKREYVKEIEQLLREPKP
jgi:thiol-disulfide isomerase/thioredoxin